MIKIIGQPKEAGFIAFTQMWESFSFFGMRALLVLYLISELGYSNERAFLLYTLYMAFAEIFGASGGVLIDRFIGYKRGVLIGGVLIMIGHLTLSVSFLEPVFFFALSAIICGASLFRVSLQSLLGLLYAKEDPQREKGFTLLYCGMNLGGLLAATSCGIAAHYYGWHAGFGLAALGMLFGMTLFIIKGKTLDRLNEPKITKLCVIIPCSLLSTIGVAALLYCFEQIHPFMILLTLITLVLIFRKLGRTVPKNVLVSLIGCLTLLTIFFAAEELWGSLLMVFSETHIDRHLFGIELPSALIAATNPLVIILFGSFLAKKQLPFHMHLSLAFLFLALAFVILYTASILPHPSVLYLIAGLSSIALGELFLTPTILSFASKHAPIGSSGLMMGATTMAFSMGSLLSGEVTKIPLSTSSLFLLILAIATLLSVILYIFSDRKNKVLV